MNQHCSSCLHHRALALAAVRLHLRRPVLACWRCWPLPSLQRPREARQAMRSPPRYATLPCCSALIRESTSLPYHRAGASPLLLQRTTLNTYVRSVALRCDAPLLVRPVTIVAALQLNNTVVRLELHNSSVSRTAWKRNNNNLEWYLC
jgi:hypothetical protein